MRNSNMKNRLAACAFLLLTSSITASGKVVYVDDDATFLGDGASWETAFIYLQDALMFTDAGDEIRVAQGIYRPDDFGLSERPSMGRDETFQLINGVTLKGGYAGLGEPDPNVRDIKLYETILSGDLEGNDADLDSPEDLLRDQTRTENSYHVVTSSGTDPNTVLDGFTITGGNSDNRSGPKGKGAGINNLTGSPMLSNCTITGNSSSLEGAGMLSGGRPTLTNCTFSDNCSDYSGGGMYGGGGVTLTNCNFIGNVADYEGGGLCTTYAEYDTILTNCTFAANKSGGRGGGILLDSDAALTNCTFNGNSTDGDGGGMFNWSDRAALTNCIFTANSAVGNHGRRGGGIFNWCGSPKMTNCTLSRNSADVGGAVYCLGPGNMMVVNCILWDNTAELGDEVALENYEDEGIFYPSEITIEYSDLMGLYAASGCTVHWGRGNIAVSPAFADADSNDYHL
ncbi:MAG: right-handed parallel beta-helix repeat-containing protein, partial [Planctomycetota bacterium]